MTLPDVVARRPARLMLIGLGVLLAVAVPIACALGSVTLSPALVARTLVSQLGIAERTDAATEAIVLQVRLPRVVIALLAGGALAIAGAAMQGLFRNPMASPNVLGVSAGGSLGAVLAISTGVASDYPFTLPLLALTGSVAATAIVYVIATGRGGTSLFFVIIAGLAISSFLNGLISAVLLFSREHDVSRFIFWTMGGLDGRRWTHVMLILPVVAPAAALVLMLSRELNLLTVGEEGAHALGLRVEAVKRVLLALAAILTGAAVSVTGTIGFVGLLVPHLLRLLVGADHRDLLPASLMGGALFVLVCDLLGRTLFSPFEIRVGVVTALVGAPYLVFLVLRHRRTGRV